MYLKVKKKNFNLKIRYLQEKSKNQSTTDLFPCYNATGNLQVLFLETEMRQVFRDFQAPEKVLLMLWETERHLGWCDNQF